MMNKAKLILMVAGIVITSESVAMRGNTFNQYVTSAVMHSITGGATAAGAVIAYNTFNRSVGAAIVGGASALVGTGYALWNLLDADKKMGQKPFAVGCLPGLATTFAAFIYAKKRGYLN